MRRGCARRDGVRGFLAAALRLPANALVLSELRAAHDLGIPYAEWAGGPRGEPWTDLDRLLHQAVRAYLADLCHGCGLPRSVTTHPDGQHHWTTPPPTRCHACTAIEHGAKAFEKQDAARALSYRATPSPALAQALANPRLAVAPTLPVTTTGDVAATPGQMVAWLTHHDLPVPADLAAAAEHAH